MYINVQVGLQSKISLESKFTCICLETFGRFTEFFLLDLEYCVSNYCIRNYKLQLYKNKLSLCGGERSNIDT